MKRGDLVRPKPGAIERRYWRGLVRVNVRNLEDPHRAVPLPPMTVLVVNKKDDMVQVKSLRDGKVFHLRIGDLEPDDSFAAAAYTANREPNEETKD